MQIAQKPSAKFSIISPKFLNNFPQISQKLPANSSKISRYFLKNFPANFSIISRKFLKNFPRISQIFLQISQKLSANFSKTSRKFFKNFPQISQKLPANFSKYSRIFSQKFPSKFLKNFPQISQKLLANSSKIFRKFLKNFPQISQKFLVTLLITSSNFSENLRGLLIFFKLPQRFRGHRGFPQWRSRRGRLNATGIFYAGRVEGTFSAPCIYPRAVGTRFPHPATNAKEIFRVRISAAAPADGNDKRSESSEFPA